MKKHYSKIVMAALLAVMGAGELHAQSAIYACGHIRRTRTTAIQNLKKSGYTTAILFNVDVAPDGTLITDYSWDNQEAAEAGGIICQDGEYVFDHYQPHYVDDIKSLLAEPTSINRIEICIGGWGNGAYGHIRDLIKAHGTGEETTLYRNFKALKEAIPEIVAVNNDQEQDYDLETAVAFHRMMAELGYKTTIAPYMNKEYWRELVAQLNETPGTCEIVYLQTYGGGAGNRPADWKVFGDIPMYIGFDCEASGNRAEMERKFTEWRDNDGVAGGFLWNYNSESRNVNEWATAINRIFPTKTAENGVATLYQDINYGGYAVSLPEGTFSQAELALYGLQAKDITSFKIDAGYRITLYMNPNCTGSARIWSASTDYVGDSWNDKACSIKIERTGTLLGLPHADTTKQTLCTVWDTSGSRLTVSGAGSSTVILYSLTGEKIASASTQDKNKAVIDTSNLPHGIYVVQSGNATAKVLKR